MSENEVFEIIVFNQLILSEHSKNKLLHVKDLIIYSNAKRYKEKLQSKQQLMTKILRKQHVCSFLLESDFVTKISYFLKECS